MQKEGDGNPIMKKRKNRPQKEGGFLKRETAYFWTGTTGVATTGTFVLATALTAAP